MQRVSAPPLAPSSKINRNSLRPTQEIAPTGAFGLMLRGLWGEDAAIELAARTRSSLRIAEYKIRGRVKPNGVDVALLGDLATREFRS